MNQRAKAALLAVILSSVLCGCGAGGGDRRGPAAIPAPAAPAAGSVGDGRLNDLIEWARASQNAPAMGAVVIRRGKIAELGVMGRRSASSAVPAQIDDEWLLGSLTKSMTATLAAALVEDGLITWDTTPLDVWPELQGKIHPGFSAVTLRQLLSHSSGMKRDDDFAGAADKAAGTVMQKRRAWAEHLLSQAPESTAGGFAYSNVGYVVAASMLETRGESPWEAQLAARVFAPLGMTRAGFGAPGTPGQLDQPLGHWSRSPGFEPVPLGPDAELPETLGPAGRVHVTLEDFARYLQAHLAGEQATSGFLTTDSFHTLHTAIAGGYALGWGVTPSLEGLGAAGFSHAGSDGRWYAVTWFSPAADAGILVTVNGGGDRGEAAARNLDDVLRRRIAASP